MNFSEYQKLAVVTKKPWGTKEGDIADCGLGISGEAGELADMLKKHLSGSKPLFVTDGVDASEDEREKYAERMEKLKFEIGDVMWYIASLCDCMGFDMGEVAEMNIAKLKKRHGDSYSGYGKR